MTPPRALVLTAGLGTRLRPLTYRRAKGAVPINGEPLARRVARWLGANGITDLVFNLHHHPETIASTLGDGSDIGVRVRYSWENPVLGSAGGPRHALSLLVEGGADRFLVVNGDTVTDVNLPALLRRHEESGAAVTMSLIRNPAPEKYGGVLVSDDGFVTRFSRRGEVSESFHFIGVQVVRRDVFAALEDGVPSESVGAVYPVLIKSNPKSVAAFVSEAAFHDIGTPADCLRTSLLLAENEGDRLIGQRAQVDATAVISRSTLWDDVTVERDARLTGCIVADGVRIAAGSVYQDSAIVQHDGRLLIQPL